MALKIMQLAEDLIKAKQVSQEAEDTLKTKVEEFMASEKIVALNKKTQESRDIYEDLREKMLKEMQKQKQMAIKTEDGANISRSILTKVVWSDEEKIVEYLEKNSPELVSKGFNKTKAKKFLLEEVELGNEVDGFETEETESLSVKV